MEFVESGLESIAIDLKNVATALEKVTIGLENVSVLLRHFRSLSPYLQVHVLLLPLLEVILRGVKLDAQSIELVIDVTDVGSYVRLSLILFAVVWSLLGCHCVSNGEQSLAKVCR